MKVILLLLFLFSSVSLLSQRLVQSSSSTLKEENGYRIRSGDKINITVLNEPDCSLTALVPDDGMVRFQYIGEIIVRDYSVKQLESLIKNEYISKKIFLRPVVNIQITQYSKRYVYLTGAVNRKGPFALPPEVEAMNIVELISMSGGFTDIARKNKVFVSRTYYRQDGKQEPKTFEVDVESLSRGTVQNQNDKFWIYPEDQINVPERIF